MYTNIFSLRNKGNLAIFNEMDGPGRHQLEKDNYCMVSLICRIKKRSRTYRNRVERQLQVAAVGGENGERLVKGYKLSFIK